MVVTAGQGEVCSLVVGVEAPISVYQLFLIFSVRQADWSVPTGREVTEYFSSGAVHLWMYFVELLVTHCASSPDYTVVGTALSPILIVDTPAIGLGVSGDFCNMPPA